jgi:hypothetical protein
MKMEQIRNYYDNRLNKLRDFIEGKRDALERDSRLVRITQTESYMLTAFIYLLSELITEIDLILSQSEEVKDDVK